MNKIFLVVFTLCLSQVMLAQRHEIGVFAGGSNVIGDVGKATYLNPFPTKTEEGGKIFLPISIGALYRFNVNPQMGFRANISYSKVGASDHRAKEQYKIDRNKNFRNNIIEGSLLFEYNFFDVNSDQETAQSPYIFFGVGAFSTKQKNYDYDPDQNAIIEKGKYKTGLSIPFGIGYKFRYNYNWILSIESGVRYTGVDYIDYNRGEFTNRFKESIEDGTLPRDEYNKRIYGNLSNKDWYVITGISLTYAFGRPACYCD